MGLDLWARTSNSKIIQAGGYQSGRLMVLGEGGTISLEVAEQGSKI